MVVQSSIIGHKCVHSTCLCNHIMTHFLNLPFPIASLQATHKPSPITALLARIGQNYASSCFWLAGWDSLSLFPPETFLPLDFVLCYSDTYWWGKNALTSGSPGTKASQHVLPDLSQMFLLWSKLSSHPMERSFTQFFDMKMLVASQHDVSSFRELIEEGTGSSNGLRFLFLHSVVSPTMELSAFSSHLWGRHLHITQVSEMEKE